MTAGLGLWLGIGELRPGGIDYPPPLSGDVFVFGGGACLEFCAVCTAGPKALAVVVLSYPFCCPVSSLPSER